MISEIDLLREDLPMLEERFGKDNLFVEVLKAQLASLQNPVDLNQHNDKLQKGFLVCLKSFIFKRKDCTNKRS